MLLKDSYLTDQLIPYIGNKRKLLPMVHNAIKLTGVEHGTFCDLLAGSGVVSRLAKRMGFRVVSNDWEPYSETINQAYVGCNAAPAFTKLGGIDAAFDALNSAPGLKGYISTFYCPEDDENPDFERERMFYTQENGRRLDAIRERIAEWKSDGTIDEVEESVLLSSLIYQASYCSNTSGVFKAFHRGWGGATSTALYRIRSRLTVRPPLFWNNGQDNIIFRGDAAEVAGRVDADIAYIDPPYNQHQYGSNYHLLNTVTLWDKPEVSRYIAPGNGPRGKSAIRLDWRTERKSPYCSAAAATDAFSLLLARIRSRFVLVSYSTDGIMPTEWMLGQLANCGSLSVITRRYKRYRVSSQRPSSESHTVEFIAIVDTSKQSDKADVSRAVEDIEKAGYDGQ